MARNLTERIYLSPETKRSLNLYQVTLGFKTSDEAVVRLLKKANDGVKKKNA